MTGSSLPLAHKRVLGPASLLGSILSAGLCLGLAGCPSDDKPQATGPQPDTACPKELGPRCKILKDETDKLSVEYHVLVAPETKHDEAQKYLQTLYRHLMTRRDSTPTNLAGYLYTNEAQFTTPPLSPVGTVLQKSGDKSPTFENKIAKELWQQVEEVLKLSERTDRKLKLKRKLEYSADSASGKVTLTLPFTEGNSDEWSKELSFAQVMGFFTQMAMDLFNNVPDLKVLVFQAQWKDQTVANIECSNADFQALKLRDIEERVGQLGGRAWLELTGGQVSEAASERRLQARRAAEYRKITDHLKGKATVSPLLK
jgi:hypothetical protein